MDKADYIRYIVTMLDGIEDNAFIKAVFEFIQHYYLHH